MSNQINVTVGSGRPEVSGGAQDAGTVKTANATVLTDVDTFAAAVVAITGDTYVAEQFVFGGGTGLTHAQWATVGALLNTAITAMLAVKTDLAPAGGDVSVSIGAGIKTRAQLRDALNAAADMLAQTNGLT